MNARKKIVRVASLEENRDHLSVKKYLAANMRVFIEFMTSSILVFD